MKLGLYLSLGALVGGAMGSDLERWYDPMIASAVGSITLLAFLRAYGVDLSL